MTKMGSRYFYAEPRTIFRFRPAFLLLYTRLLRRRASLASANRRKPTMASKKSPKSKTAAPKPRKLEKSASPKGGTITLKIGSITMTIDAGLDLPAEAGKLTAAEIKRLPKARIGVGEACDRTAKAIEDAGDSFMAPKAIDPATLRMRATRATGMDTLVRDAEHVVFVLKQANLLVDSEAHLALCRVNDQLKTQSKDTPSLKTRFKDASQYFKNAAKKAPATTPAPAK